MALAEKLTQSLRDTGDLDLVDIDLQSYVVMFRAHRVRFSKFMSPGNHHLHLEMMTKLCFRQRRALNLLNLSCSLSVHSTS